MQICTLLTRIHCKVSDTQVTVKACEPLVDLYLYTRRMKLVSFITIKSGRDVWWALVVDAVACILKNV